MFTGSRRDPLYFPSYAANAAVLRAHASSATDATAKFYWPYGDRVEGDGGTREG